MIEKDNSIDKELKTRIREIIFDFLCWRLKEGKIDFTSFDEVVDTINKSIKDNSIQIQQIKNLNLNDDLIESVEHSGFRLTPHGIKKCQGN